MDENFDIEVKQSEITEKLALVLTKLKHDTNRDNDRVKKPELEDKNAYFGRLENFFKHYPWQFETYDPLGRTLPDGYEESMALDEQQIK